MKKQISKLTKVSLALTTASGISIVDAQASQNLGFSYLGSGKTLRNALVQMNSGEVPHLASGTSEDKDSGEMKCGEGQCGEKMMEKDSSSSQADDSEESEEIDTDGSAAENPPADD